MFIRPHLVDLHRQEPAGGSFRARVVRVNPAGPLVKVELVTEWGDSARAELTQDRYRAAPVACGDDVFVSAREAVLAAAETSDCLTAAASEVLAQLADSPLPCMLARLPQPAVLPEVEERSTSWS